MAVDSASPLDIDSAINFNISDKIDIDSAINTAIGIAVPTVIDTNAKIDIDSAIDTTVGIVVPTITNTISSETEVDIAGSVIIDTALPSAADLTLVAIIIEPTLGTAGAVLVVVEAYVEEDAHIVLEDARDLLEKARDVALVRSIVYQQNLRNYHSRRVRGRSFEPGNLVLCLKQEGTLKLASPWEGPYLVHEAIPGGAYWLCDPKTGVDIENPWNAQQLRRFYP
jgi:hypothetical protein